MSSMGVEMEDSILGITADGKVWIPAGNSTRETIKLPTAAHLGEVTVLPNEEGEEADTSQLPIPQHECVASIYSSTKELDSQQKDQLVDCLAIPEGTLHKDDAQKLIDCALAFHDVFAVADNE